MGNRLSRRRRTGRRSEEESVHVCEVLDQLGYSLSMVKHRRESWRERDGILNKKIQNKTEITAGSKSKGFTARYESDTDRMYLDNYTVCRIPGDDSLTLPDTHNEFKMNSKYCHPGHFRLELKHIGTMENSTIQQALFDNNIGKTFISSEKYRMSYIKDKTKEKVSGPAVTGCSGYVTWDNVYAFRCLSQQKLLSEWINRRRHHNWPTPDLIAEVSKLEAQVVPVGCKSSERKDIEWRVCFILTEQRVTDSWNENQYEIYILLKFIKKSQLKPICDEISSYLLKNIVLWYTEQNCSGIFKNKYLLNNVISCLKILKEAIQSNHLRYYMIPDRNLLTGKINPEQQQQLIEKLDQLITEGPHVILRCPKVKSALQMSPVDLAEKGQWRDELEKLDLESVNIWWKYWRPGVEWKEVTKLAWGNPHYKQVWERMRDMVWPQWMEYQGDDYDSILRKKLADSLS